MEEQNLKGLGGWLILIGFGVVLAPIRLLGTVLPIYSSIFQDGTWEALTTPGSGSYSALWGPILVGEMVFNSAMLCASVYLAFLFFSKNYRFPKLYIGILLVSLAFIPVDTWFVSLAAPEQPMFDTATKTEFGRTLLACAIWIPYMTSSERVSATFVNG